MTQEQPNLKPEDFQKQDLEKQIKDMSEVDQYLSDFIANAPLALGYLPSGSKVFEAIDAVRGEINEYTKHVKGEISPVYDDTLKVSG